MTSSITFSPIELRQRRNAMMSEDVMVASDNIIPMASLSYGDDTVDRADTHDATYSPSKTTTPKRPKVIKQASGSRRSSSGLHATPPASPSKKGIPSSNTSPSKLALKFNGHVYRTLDSTLAGVSYSTQGDFFGRPDESVGEMEREKRDVKREEMERKMLIEKGNRTTPTKRRRPSFELPTRSHRLLLDAVAPTTVNLGLPFAATKPTIIPSAVKRQGVVNSRSALPDTPLPPMLLALLRLHTSLESALVAHLAEDGSSLASSTASPPNAKGEKTIRIPKLIDYVKLKSLLESGGNKFSETELARLLWIWEGCGLVEVPSETEDEEELTVGEEGQEILAKGRGGLGFTISTTRTIGLSGQVIATYALGITLIVQHNVQLPPMTLLPPSSPSRSAALLSSPSSRSPGRKVMVTGLRSTSTTSSASVSGRGSMSTVALWSQGSESRKMEVARRLREWALSASIPSAIPQAELPSLVPILATLIPPSPTKRKTVHDTNGVIQKPAPGVVLVEKAAKVSKVGGSKQRAQALLDRIQAKQTANQPTIAYLASFTALNAGDSPSGMKSLRHSNAVAKAYEAERSEMFRKRSLLSRMGAVADSVWMLFSMSNSRRPILLDQVAISIAKSAQIALSFDEAVEALDLLYTTCPEFINVKEVDRQSWMVIKGEIELRQVKDRFIVKLREAKLAVDRQGSEA